MSTRFRTCAQAPGSCRPSTDCLSTLSQQSFGSFLELKRSMPSKEKKLRRKENQALCTPVFNVEDGQRDKSEGDPERGRYAFRRELEVDCLTCGESRARAAQTREGMDVRLGSLAAVLSPDHTDVAPCHLPRTGGRPLLARHSGEDQRGHQDSAVRDEELPGYFFAATDDVSASPIRHSEATIFCKL